MVQPRIPSFLRLVIAIFLYFLRSMNYQLIVRFSEGQQSFGGTGSRCREVTWMHNDEKQSLARHNSNSLSQTVPLLADHFLNSAEQHDYLPSGVEFSHLYAHRWLRHCRQSPVFLTFLRTAGFNSGSCLVVASPPLLAVRWVPAGHNITVFFWKSRKLA